MVLTSTEKLFHIFSKKFLQIRSEQKRDSVTRQYWVDYLGSIPEIKYIYNFSDNETPVGYLLEEINSSEGGFNKFVIRDPYSYGKDYFIIIEKEFALKVIVLGHLP